MEAETEYDPTVISTISSLQSPLTVGLLSLLMLQVQFNLGFMFVFFVWLRSLQSILGSLCL